MASGGSRWAEPMVPNQRPYGATSRSSDGAFLHGQRPWSPATGMNKNLLNQEEDVNAKWNGIGFEAHILTCYLFWSKCLKVLIEGVFLLQ